MQPVLQALVLAEKIYTDQTGMKIIAGTFNSMIIGSSKITDTPKGKLVQGGTDPGCPSVYVSLTDVVDNTQVTLQWFDLAKNLALLHTDVTLRSNNRLQTIELVLPLPPLLTFLRAEGTYSLDLIWKGEILGSHRFFVRREEDLQEGEEL